MTRDHLGPIRRIDFEPSVPKPSPLRRAYRSCYGKDALTHQEAIERVNRLTDNGKYLSGRDGARGELVAYYCRFCRNYHVGHARCESE